MEGKEDPPLPLVPSGKEINEDDENSLERGGIGALLSRIRQDPEDLVPDEEEVKDMDYVRSVCDLPKVQKLDKPDPEEGDAQAEEPPASAFSSTSADENLYCADCDVQCNSLFMYDQHIHGSKHYKRTKYKILKRLPNSDSSSNKYSANTPYRANGHHDTASLVAEEAKKKRVEMDLRSFLAVTEEPVIGLHYIDEIYPETNSSLYEVMYTCNLCGVSALKDPMINHILGIKHRNKHSDMKFGMKGRDREDTRQFAAEIEAEEGRRVDLIKTVISDKLYPWPNGVNCKNPIFPSNVQKDASTIVLDPPPPIQAAPPLPLSNVSTVISTIAGCDVKTLEDAKLAHDVASSLIKAIVKYKSHTVDPKNSSVLFAGCDNLLRSLDAICNLPQTYTPPLSSGIQIPSLPAQPIPAPPPPPSQPMYNPALYSTAYPIQGLMQPQHPPPPTLPPLPPPLPAPVPAPVPYIAVSQPI